MMDIFEYKEVQKNLEKVCRDVGNKYNLIICYHSHYNTPTFSIYPLSTLEDMEQKKDNYSFEYLDMSIDIDKNVKDYEDTAKRIINEIYGKDLLP